MVFFPLILIFVSGVANGAMDSFVHHYYSSLWRVLWLKKGWKFFRPDGWKNKYREDSPLKGRVKFFWNLLNVPVAFLDTWHFSKSVMLWSLMLAFALFIPGTPISVDGQIWFIPMGTWALTLIISRGLFGLGFFAAYRLFGGWNKKKGK
jgi:hypothetical protein